MAVNFQNFQLDAATVSSAMYFYYQLSKETEEDCRLKLAVKTEIEHLIGSAGLHVPSPSADGQQQQPLLCLIGSSADGFGLAEGELDLAVVRSSFQTLSEEQIVLLIRYIVLSYLNVQLNEDAIRGAPDARVPIISFTVTPNPANATAGSPLRQTRCHLSIRENAIRNTRLLAWFVKRDPRTAILFAVIKKWATLKGVFGTRNGYLSSFPWKLLLIHFLQQGCVPALLPKVSLSPAFRELPRIEVGLYQCGNMADLVFGFFQFYSTYQFAGLRISIVNTYQPLHRLTAMDDDWPVYIEDPFDPRVNCARDLRPQAVVHMCNAFVSGYRETAMVIVRDVLSKLSHLTI